MYLTAQMTFLAFPVQIVLVELELMFSPVYIPSFTIHSVSRLKHKLNLVSLIYLKSVRNESESHENINIEVLYPLAGK